VARRRPHDTLIRVALAVLVAQCVLLAALWARPEAPALLTPRHREVRDKPIAGTVAPTGVEAATVGLLDDLFSQRVARAAARNGVDPARYFPPEALKAAALANPDPRGEPVKALIAAYADQLAELGEPLDAGVSPTAAGAAAQ
jgi:hypothetical protein